VAWLDFGDLVLRIMDEVIKKRLSTNLLLAKLVINKV
jgi:hypothetical protein